MLPPVLLTRSPRDETSPNGGICLLQTLLTNRNNHPQVYRPSVPVFDQQFPSTLSYLPQVPSMEVNRRSTSMETRISAITLPTVSTARKELFCLRPDIKASMEAWQAHLGTKNG